MQDRRTTTVRQELPVHRLLALVVQDLDVLGDPERGAAPVHGVDLEIEAGTLVFLNPTEGGRTVILYLSGLLAPRSVRHVATTARSSGHTASDWRCVLVPSSSVTGSSVEATTSLQDHLDSAGPGATRVARRLGLGEQLSTPVAELAAWQLVLARLATSCADSPDIVALDDPTAGMDEHDTIEIVSAIRDLVDTDGRTVLLTCDLPGMPGAAHQLADQIVDLGSACSVLLASRT